MSEDGAHGSGDGPDGVPPSPAEETPEPEGTSLPMVAPTVALPPFASLGDRLAAQVIDGLIAFGLLFLIGGTLVRHLGGFIGPALDPQIVGAGIAIAATLVILLGYFILFEKQLGLTLGKIAAGIRVRNGTGGRISGRAAFVRNVIRVLEALTLYILSAFLVLVTRRSQRLGDLFAGTIVVRHEAPRPARVAAFLLALLIAVAGVVGGLAINGVGAAQQDGGFLAGPAPSPSPSSPPGRPRIASAVLTDSATSEVNRTAFSPDTPEIFARVALADVPPGSTLQAIWIAESVAGRPNDSRMDEIPPVDVGGTRNQANLSHQRPPNGWPTGTYRVDLYLSGQFDRTLRFTVQANGLSPATSPLPAASPAPNGAPALTPPGAGTQTTITPGLTSPASPVGTAAPATRTLGTGPTPGNGATPVPFTLPPGTI